MLFFDNHVHSDVSFDGNDSYKNFILTAKEIGLGGITFTEHCDIYDGMDPHDEKARPFDNAVYKEKFEEAKSLFGDFIKMGVEIGLRPDKKEKVREISKYFDYDFIIGSSHVVCMKNISHDFSFYEGLTKDEAYEKYLYEVYENVKLHHESFDVYGHLDYVIRYGGFADTKMSLSDIIDEILSLLIRQDKGIEINTAFMRMGNSDPHPNYDIIKRYRELGGKIITLGSDAHRPEHLAFGFSEAAERLLSIGFKEYAVYTKRKPEFFGLQR